MKKVIFISLLCQITLIFGQGTKNVSQNDDMISNFMRLSTQQQLDTADYYFEMNNYDSALIFLNLLIKTIPHDADIERQYILQNAYHTMSNIYFFFSDYRMVYDLLIKRLFICEKYDFICEKSSTYNNIGLVYGNINQIDMAKDYFLKALNSCSDSLRTSVILYNLGTYEFKNNIDSAYNYLNKAIEVAQQHDNYSLNSFGLYYQYKKQYDSAFYYFRLSLDYSIKNNDIIVKATNFSDLAKLFFEVNNIDSALYYIDLSNKIAFENKFLDRLADNYLTLSEIEKSKGRYKNALKYYETYVSLKDSITNSGVYGSINLIQRQYEVSKTDRQIEELIIDRQIKENTIHYQRIIQRNTMVALVALIIVLGVVLLQDNKLRKAYKVLVDKNVEIVDMMNTSPSPSKDTSPSPSKGGEVETDNYPSLQNGEMVNEEVKTDNYPSSQNEAIENEAMVKTDNYPSLQNENVNETPETTPETATAKPKPRVAKKTPTAKGKNEKYKNIAMSENFQKELLCKILFYMEQPSIICNSDFTMEQLAESLNSNHLYVSYIINKIIKKNFRSFLNGYRIREAQRLFSVSNKTRYSIEFIANKVGYKSRNSFNDAFKEITGVTPAFYVKAVIG